MTFDWRRFLTILILSGLAAFLTFLVIQYFQGQFDDLGRTALKASLMGLGLALLFSLERGKKDYPWQ
ncbi:MAG TPA: hypothetical protein VLX61_00580 [Anaerolineales bacterium]|nr:hypothetical protein [Anaerolineales bacterium]